MQRFISPLILTPIVIIMVLIGPKLFNLKTYSSIDASNVYSFKSTYDYFVYNQELTKNKQLYPNISEESIIDYTIRNYGK